MGREVLALAVVVLSGTSYQAWTLEAEHQIYATHCKQLPAVVAMSHNHRVPCQGLPASLL